MNILCNRLNNELYNVTNILQNWNCTTSLRKSYNAHCSSKYDGVKLKQ